MKYQKNINTKIGTISIIEENRKIIAIQIKDKKQQEAVLKETPLLKETEKQLTDYLEGKIKSFNVPLNLKGTEFMKKVWTALQDIPYGETRTYEEIAKSIGNPKAARAVGMANHVNPIPILIPCHRVIGKNGKLVGYALGIEKKQFLLELEKRGRD